ncbi:MAG TPA: FliH/SctL family protein [Limnobacter sp.]|uniref:FliH/SctL family protein n=1 Tax=Limnobacter sp. TaxID=2003368 RepID=UPI002E32F44E|nr:FliH/SctL family protein [Limnobacter sp.]HEX5487291.1 FliH/SctL family protein [Limnobacter sp.]
MLRLIRRIEFPSQIRISGYCIKAKLLRHARTYQDIVAIAEDDAKLIAKRAREAAEKLQEATRSEVAQSVKGDLHQLRVLTRQKDQVLHKTLANTCSELSAIVLEQFVHSQSDFIKIKSLIEALIKRSHSARALILKVHPNQVCHANQALAQIMAEQLNVRKWEVIPDENLEPYQIRISANNGAEINVSLQNMLALYQEELDRLIPDLRTSINVTEVNDESFL